MDSNSKIYVAGNTGLVGSAIIRMLHEKGFDNILSTPSSDWDLRNQEDVNRFFRINKPDYVFLAAAKVGGIGANSEQPADFIYDNLMIQTNIIDAAYRNGVKKLLFLGSSCIYPKFANQPIVEDELMSGPLEPSNSAYAVAKIAGIKMCQAYRKQYGFNAIALMPTNLYGPHDNFDHNSGHVLPSLISKFHGSLEKSKHWEVALWGDGTPMREFLHVDDLAEAAYTCMEKYDSDEVINIGTGEDVTIKELAETIAGVTGYKNNVKWHTDKPNGTPRKVLNVDRVKALGWEPKIGLRDGIESTYQWYKAHVV